MVLHLKLNVDDSMAEGNKMKKVKGIYINIRPLQQR